MSAAKLLGIGAALLASSLLVTLAVTTSVTASGRGVAVAAWLAQVLLFVGSGLVVAGALLRALQQRDDLDDRTPGADHYG